MKTHKTAKSVELIHTVLVLPKRSAGSNNEPSAPARHAWTIANAKLGIGEPHIMCVWALLTPWCTPQRV